MKPITHDLGSQLHTIMKELEAAGVTGADAQSRADIDAIRKERDQLKKWLDEVYKLIVDEITSGKVPVVKVKDYSAQDWLRLAVEDKAKHQDLWSTFDKTLSQSGLQVTISEAHDGGGMEGWINLYVRPIHNGTRS